MKKILIIQNSISSYRVPVYNLIAQEFDLTIMYSEGKEPLGACFKSVYLPVKRWKHYFWHKNNLRDFANQYDVVIGMISFNWISNYLLAFGKRRYKYIPWGIGVPASYSVRFDDPSKKLNVFLTKQLLKRSDAVLFYTDYPVKKYSDMDIDRQKMFVAHNTVKVLPMKGGIAKNSILFVGTLYKAKSSLAMLEYYKKAYTKNNNVPLLRLVGNGDEFDDLKKWTQDNHLDDKIILEGACYDESVLRDYFESAYACVSLGQAGLSVQKAMGYGVPYITTKDAYTGGERLDIADGENGIILNSEEEFENIVLDIATSSEKYMEMGRKAKSFYDNNRTIQMMASAVVDAINYVI